MFCFLALPHGIQIQLKNSLGKNCINNLPVYNFVHMTMPLQTDTSADGIRKNRTGFC